MNLQLSARPGARCTVLEIRGDLDMDTVAQLRDALEPLSGPGEFVLDLSGVPFMDSSALGAVVLTYKAIRAAGGRLSLAGVQPTVATVLRVTSVDQVIDVYDTVAAAEASIR